MGEESIEQNDFLLDFYKENPDSIFKIGEWETELQCAACSGSIPKDANCLFNQQFPTENVARRNLALKDARCPHCMATGEIKQISASQSVYLPLPAKVVWFRRLVIDPPVKLVKTLFGFKEEPQEQRSIKEYRL
jgi:hypothetical protein